MTKSFGLVPSRSYYIHAIYSYGELVLTYRTSIMCFRVCSSLNNFRISFPFTMHTINLYLIFDLKLEVYAKHALQRNFLAFFY
jgi:hypothetical protein